MKILIADGSSVYKKMFMKATAETDKNASVTCVADGAEALDEIRRGNYDIIVVDAEISGAGVIELLKEIKREIPKALVLVTARPFVSNANGKICDEAMAKGATDCMIKPLYNSYAENVEMVSNKLSELIKIYNETGADKAPAVLNRPVPASKPVKTKKILVNDNKFQPEIILIAASTGGPLALEHILSVLRGDLPAPVLIVQHMPVHFVETLTQNLDRKSNLKIKVAEATETVGAGTVYIAPGGRHMKLDEKNRIYFEDSPPIHGVRPAADALFESVADSFRGEGVLAVILTGMGSDGQKGLYRLKEKQACFCMVQSEETCVVYGMPRAAAETGLADKIVDLDKIPGETEKFYFAPEHGDD